MTANNRIISTKLALPKGEQIPQTVESLQEVMAKDAVLMEEMSRDLTRVRRENHSLKSRLAKARKRHSDLQKLVRKHGNG